MAKLLDDSFRQRLLRFYLLESYYKLIFIRVSPDTKQMKQTYNKIEKNSKIENKEEREKLEF